MSEPQRAYRIVAADGGDVWFDDLAAAHTEVAARLGVAGAELSALQRRVNTDPVVVRRDDARWRSGAGWIYRSGAATVRVVEMIRVDEAQYDHDH